VIPPAFEAIPMAILVTLSFLAAMGVEEFLASPRPFGSEVIEVVEIFVVVIVRTHVFSSSIEG
jgi:hypothetical protein